MNFIKARYRRIGISNRPVIDIDGIQDGKTIGISPGMAYALRDALSAALDDYEIEQKGCEKQ